MAFNSRYGAPVGGFSMSLTPWVKRLLVANVGIFVLMLVIGSFRNVVEPWLALRPAALLEAPYPVWTLLTYGFVHAGVGHVFFNMLALFFLGPALEEHWGSRSFIRFYLACVLGGALFSLAQPYATIVGASAATNGLLLAYAMLWPDREFHFWGIFPIKVKWLAIFAVAVSILSAAGGDSGSGTAHLAHLGGLAMAFVIMKSPWAPRGWGEVPLTPKKRKSPALAAWKGAAKAQAQPARPASAPPPPARAERDMLDDVDRILDKISAQGIASLTDEEKKRLHDLSRQRRTN